MSAQREVLACFPLDCPSTVFISTIIIANNSGREFIIESSSPGAFQPGRIVALSDYRCGYT